MNDLRETTAKYLKQLGEDYKKGIIGNMMRKKRHASHETERSLEAVVERKGFMVNLKILGKAKSALYLESGWQPAPRDPSFVGVILNWLEEKGLSTGNIEEDVSVAARIAGRIVQDGTILYREQGTTKIYSDMVDESLTDVESMLQSIITGNVYQTNEELNSK